MAHYKGGGGPANNRESTKKSSARHASAAERMAQVDKKVGKIGVTVVDRVHDRRVEVKAGDNVAERYVELFGRSRKSKKK